MSSFARLLVPNNGCVVALMPETLQLAHGDQCVVEVEPGQLDVGKYMGLETQAATATKKSESPLPRILRLATAADLTRAADNADRADKALQRFVHLLGEAGIVVKPLAAHYRLKRDHLLFIFSSPEHIDCRQVVGKMQGEIQTRIEVWHAAARDEMAVAGGIGPCGRLFCCATWLRQLQSVNIRMAKEQGIEPTPAVINGCCGKLKCCLRFESQ